MEVGVSGCIFQWKIENISHFWLKGKQILSPMFTSNILEDTEWSISLYPEGVNEQEGNEMSELDNNNVNIYLLKLPGSDGPEEMEVNYQMAFLDKDGSILIEKTQWGESFGYDSGFDDFVTRERVFVTEREAFLPEDTLTVQCTIWKTEEEPGYPELLSARTVFNLNRRSLIWKIDNFSTVESGRKYDLKEDIFKFELVLNGELDIEKKLLINVEEFSAIVKYCAIKTFIVKSKEKREQCGFLELFEDDVKKGILCTLLFTKKLMENKSQYLPNDVLSLELEYVCSNGDVVYEYSGSGIISHQSKNEVSGSGCDCITNMESVNTSVLVNDLKSMYNDGICSDLVLCTSTQTFLTHKSILSARSPVFRSMFSSDMKERNCGRVDIIDLEDDTIHRMLLYIYTGSVENLQFESAFKLYIAADKYGILSLQSSCSSFLTENLCPTNACDALILADRHNDEDLKDAVQNFILKQQKQIFCSEEWKNFMKTHVKLASDVMYQKILWDC